MSSKGIGALWDARYASGGRRHIHQEKAPAFALAAEFLDAPDVEVVEDWGCGVGHFAPFLAPRQTCIGVDGSQHSAASRIVDLEHYRSGVDAVHMRGVIEHNPGWRTILLNAIASFTKRAVLTVYEPFVEEYYITRPGKWVVQRFTREQIEGAFEGLTWTELRAPRPKGLPGEETLFCFER